ncbi:MAG: PqqD family protein [Alphaproteobacteria bacterium]|nr:PqqD family protein [Alphaproteobacteria bacterium]
MSNFSEETIFDFCPVASFQPVGDGAVILLADSGQIYSCNETTESFLRKVDGVQNLGAIVAALAVEYEVDGETLTADMAELAQELIDEGIIKNL